MSPCVCVCLLQILNMQNYIAKNITATYKNSSGEHVPVKLNDICFQPLYPDNRNCTIYSVLNYFQNSHELLYTEAREVIAVTSNSSTHIRYCTRYPICVIITRVIMYVGIPRLLMIPTLAFHVWQLMVVQWIPMLLWVTLVSCVTSECDIRYCTCMYTVL